MFRTIVDPDRWSEKRSKGSEEEKAKWDGLEKEFEQARFNRAWIDINNQTKTSYKHEIR